MRILTTLLILAGSPALAASGPFISLGNTDFVVLIAFLLFVGVLFYFKVPSSIGKMLDARAASITAELAEAKALRDEAQSLLASYERKQREVSEQAERIVASAKDEAQQAAVSAKEEIATSVARKLAAAEEQITSAQASAIKAVKDQAVIVAVAAATDVIAKQMDATRSNALIDEAIDLAGEKLH